MRLPIFLSRLLDSIAVLIFGKAAVCALCGVPLSTSRSPFIRHRAETEAEQIGICQSCLDKLSSEMAWVCQVCGAPIRPPLRLCSDCQKNLYVFDGQRSVGIYQGDLKNAIARMKFQGERWIAKPLAALMEKSARVFSPVDILVPVPLEPGSLRRRGYNQALDLSKELSLLTGVPVMDILKREKRYAHQAELGRDMRWSNLKESMSPRREMNLRTERVLLVDDVTTTGATLDEAARVLKDMGADKVFCVTAARTMKR